MLRALHLIGMLAAAAAMLVGVRGTGAVLNDQVAMAHVSVQAGSVLAPGRPTLTASGSSISVGWTAPAGGITPDGYEVFRREANGAWPATPLGAPTTRQLTDVTAAECTTWEYRVRARRLELRSDFSATRTISVDRTAPQVVAAHGVFTSGPAPVADFIRASGGSVDIYAQVQDACVASSELDVSFDFGALGTVEPTSGSWTPIAGGPTYTHRFTFPVPGGMLSNGAVVNWTVRATDPGGRTVTTAGTPIRVDGSAPTFVRAEMVSARTNYYDVTLGRGEIPSDGAARGDGFYVYAEFSDASGIASITADANLSTAQRIRTNGDALPLTAGSWSTANGVAWPWRSAAWTANTGLTDGTRTFTVTAVDRVGNAARTSAAQQVEIDDTALNVTSCVNANGGTTNRLDTGDQTRLQLNDTLDPGSVRAGWTGVDDLPVAPVLRARTGGTNGPNQFFHLNVSGLALLRGSAGSATAFDLGTTNGFTAPTTFGSSRFERGPAVGGNGSREWRMVYGGASITAPTYTSTFRWSNALRDAAGNVITANRTSTCSTNPW